MKKHINSSVNYNVALASFSFLKVLTSASILSYTKNLCSKPFIDIAVYMIVHDVSYIFSLLMKIRTIIKGIFAFVPDNGSNENNNSDSQALREHLSNFIPQVQTGELLFQISEEAEKKNHTVNAISTLSKAY